MKVFTCDTFEGFYPIGGSAIIVAPDVESAVTLLEVQLDEEGLAQKINASQLTEIDVKAEQAIVIDNGNY